MSDILTKAEQHQEAEEANKRVVQMKLAQVVDYDDEDDDVQDDEDDDQTENDENDENDDGDRLEETSSAVPTLESIIEDSPTKKNGSNNKKKKTTAKTMKQELKKAQDQQSVATFVFLLLFFIGVSIVIHMGDARELFHFLERGWRVEVYLDRICYCNASFISLENCEAMGDNWVIGDPSSYSKLSKTYPTQLYCLDLYHDINVCENFSSRLNATHIMIVVLFATFVVINLVALSITVLTVLRRVLSDRVEFLGKIFRSLSKVFGPALLCAVMFVPAATLVGLSASGVLLSLFIDTMCRETPQSFFVRPVIYRTDFTLGSGAIFILAGTLTGFVVLIGGIIWTVKSRAALSELHDLEREEQLRKLMRSQRRKKGRNLSMKSNASDGSNSLYQRRSTSRPGSVVGAATTTTTNGVEEIAVGAANHYT